jgi:hypothetical protein
MEKPKQEKTKANRISIIVGAVAFAITSYGVQQLFFSNEPFDKQMKDAAIEVNKKCPMVVDEYSRLDSASTIDDKNFLYYYTLVDIEKSEVNLDTVNKYIRPNIISNVKNTPELKVFRDNKVTIDYNYYDKNGVFVTKISVTPEMYTEE